MNFLLEWLSQCSNCFPSSTEILSTITDLAKNCSHQSTTIDRICEECFVHFFRYDRFIIRQLFLYLDPRETKFVQRKDFDLFAQRILHWQEYIHHLDFLLQFVELLSSKDYIYQLLKDAFFFTAIQTNVSTDLTRESEIFLRKFGQYFSQLNEHENKQIYFNLIKRTFPWGLISIHKWLKICLLSLPHKREEISFEWHSNLPMTLLWYLTNWLVSNKVFLNEYDPLLIFEKVARKEFLHNLYDSDRHGFSLVTLSQSTAHIDGPFLLIFSCNDERIFAILLEGNLIDSAKAYGGRASLCLQLSPQFLILERGPSILYWNVRKRMDGPLAIRIGHQGISRVSLDLNMEYIHHPEGSSRINRVEIYKFGPYKTPVCTSILRRKAEHNEYNLLSVDAHKLVESIGVHLFT